MGDDHSLSHLEGDKGDKDVFIGEMFYFEPFAPSRACSEAIPSAPRAEEVVHSGSGRRCYPYYPSPAGVSKFPRIGSGTATRRPGLSRSRLRGI